MQKCVPAPFIKSLRKARQTVQNNTASSPSTHGHKNDGMDSIRSSDRPPVGAIVLNY